MSTPISTDVATCVGGEGQSQHSRNATETGAGREAPWQVAHERLARFAKARSGLDWEEGRLLRAAFAAGAHARLGFGSFAEYVERLFGYGPRHARERLRVAEALEGLPKLSQALQRGELTWSAVRELTRVAIPRTESEWLEASRERTARDVEELVAGHRAGDRPLDLPDPSIRRHRLWFEVSGETRALVAEALAKLRRESGGPLDDDGALLLMSRSVLGGPGDDGRANYQVEVTICERCRRGEQLGNGTRSEVRPEVVEMCECDAQHLACSLPRESTEVEAHGAGRASRATQTIPPALRRQVLRRDSGRCVVSGCRNSTFIDVHHLVPRAAGGQHELENLVCLCGAHHRAVHENTLVIEGRPATGLRFFHSDGRRYGNVGSHSQGETHPRRIDAEGQVTGALKGLGFRDGEVRWALQHCQVELGSDATPEEILRRSLEYLAARAV